MDIGNSLFEDKRVPSSREEGAVMIYDKSLYPAVARRMRAALRASGYEAEAAAVDQCLRTSISEAIAVGWKLLYIHDLQYFMSFEEELLSFGCLSQAHDEMLYQSARHMLEDYMDKNADRVNEFLGGYDVGCSVAMTEPNDRLSDHRSQHASKSHDRGFGIRLQKGSRPVTQKTTPVRPDASASSVCPACEMSADASSVGVCSSGLGDDIGDSAEVSRGISAVGPDDREATPSTGHAAEKGAGEKDAGEKDTGEKSLGEKSKSVGTDNTSDIDRLTCRSDDTTGRAQANSARKDGAWPEGASKGTNGTVRTGAEKTWGGEAVDQALHHSDRSRAAAGQPNRKKNPDAFPPVGTLLTYRKDLRRSLRCLAVDDKARQRQLSILRRMEEAHRRDQTGHEGGAPVKGR